MFIYLLQQCANSVPCSSAEFVRRCRRPEETPHKISRVEKHPLPAFRCVCPNELPGRELLQKKFTFACRKEPVSTSAGSEAKRVRRLVCGFLVTLSHQLIEFTKPDTRPVLSFGRFDGGRRNCGCGGPPKRRVPTLVLNLSSAFICR